MSICQECGSEVAEQDVFCPYCGISLQPVAVPADDNAAMESTIVMQAPLPEILSDVVEPVADVSGDEAAGKTTDDMPPASAAPSLNEPEFPAPVEELVEAPGSVADVQIDESEDPVPEAVEPVSVAGEGTLDEVSAELEAPESFVIEEIAAQPAETPAVAEDPVVESLDEVAAAPTDEPAESEPAADVADVSADDASEISEPEPDAAESGETNAPVGEPKYPFSLVESDVMIQTDVEPTEPVESNESVESVETAGENEVGIRLEEADVVMSAPFAAPSHPDTSSGEIVAEDNGSGTNSIDQGNTDGKRTGLKPLSEGTILNGRYKIVKKIGGGGMGAVYLAVDQNLGGTQRAVKEMVQSHIEEEQQAKAIEDFKRESMILSTLDHPSIPTIYDYFYDEAESRFYLVMKYISGGDLAGRLRAAPEGRIDERTVTEWAVQVIDVLHYLHSLPTTIVYRDLKPSNVMIDGNTGRIMLIDFGIARSINQNQEKGVTAVGTMGYAPPELFSGQVEPRSDIYSLGSTMFHLLTGADPQNNPLLIFDFQKNPRPRQINPRLSDQIERILMRAVEYNADARFSSALEMKLALQQHLDDLSAGRVSYGITEAPAAISLANQNVFCGFCGQRIVATDLFCAFCGSKQPLAQHGVHSEIYGARSAATARLVIEGTSQLEMPAYLLDKNENLIGRRDPTSNIFPEVDLSKFDPQTKISRRHARVWRDGSSFLVEDLGSSNGTILLSTVSDTLRLTPHQAHPLANGDRIRVGDTTLHFIIS